MSVTRCRVKELEEELSKAKRLQDLLLECLYHGFTLRELSGILGVSVASLSRWLRGVHLPRNYNVDDLIHRLEGVLRSNSMEFSSIQDFDESSISSSFAFNVEIPMIKRFKRLDSRIIRKIRKTVYGDVEKLNKCLSYLTFYAGTLNITNKVLLQEAGNIVKRYFNVKRVRVSELQYVALASIKIAALRLRIGIHVDPERYNLNSRMYRDIFSRLAGMFLA